MFLEMTTTITHRITLGGENGIESIEHSVEVDGGEIAEILGTHNTMLIVRAGCDAAIKAIDADETKVVHEEDSDDE